MVERRLGLSGVMCSLVYPTDSFSIGAGVLDVIVSPYVSRSCVAIEQYKLDG